MVLYFAFGSNLWLDQMARRCPDSEYIGRAILTDYKWQINQRGFANVVPCAGSCVHGLVYRINAADEAQLDRSEGVSARAYDKVYHNVVLYTAPSAWRKPTPDVLASVAARHHGEHAHARRKPEMKKSVLVYISTAHTTPGPPKSEYVKRINHGIHDAVQLGVPASYFDNAVRADIPRQDIHRTPTSTAAEKAKKAAAGTVLPNFRHRASRSRRESSSGEPPRRSDTGRQSLSDATTTSRSKTRSTTAPAQQSSSRFGMSFFRAIGMGLSRRSPAPPVADVDRPRRHTTSRSGRSDREHERTRRSSTYESHEGRRHGRK